MTYTLQMRVKLVGWGTECAMLTGRQPGVATVSAGARRPGTVNPDLPRQRLATARDEVIDGLVYRQIRVLVGVDRIVGVFGA